MNKDLLRRYQEYASSCEAQAVIFVKKYLSQSKGHWVDVKNYRRYEMSDDDLHFRFVEGALYKRHIKPNYPPKAGFYHHGKFDERRYYFAVRAITWETAHRDIEQQKSSNAVARQFKITGVSYDKSRSVKGYFRNDAPPEIKALANNLLDKTDPLWDIAVRYVNEPEYIYKIKKIEVD